MAYATQQDIEDRYGEDLLVRIADKDGDDDADTTPVAEALDDAAGVIDAFVGKRYDVPLSAPVPRIVLKCNVDLAVYQLAQSWGALTDEIKARAEQCEKWLAMIAAGDLSLGLDVPAESIGGGASIEVEDRVFTREMLRGLS